MSPSEAAPYPLAQPNINRYRQSSRQIHALLALPCAFVWRQITCTHGDNESEAEAACTHPTHLPVAFAFAVLPVPTSKRHGDNDSDVDGLFIDTERSNADPE